jgi:acetone carboxylase alpha subunit
VHARETAKKIAASPIVEQEGELCFTLYNAAGDCILTSTGIIIHVGTMGAAIKYMIENDWESNPGIDPGDMFTNNDCQIGNVHPCDVATIVPIFWENRLIGWVGGVTHVIDTRRGDARLDVDGPSPALRRRLHRHVSQDRRQRQAAARLAA